MKRSFMKILLAFLLMLTNITPVFSESSFKETLSLEQAKIVQKALLGINTAQPFKPGDNETEPDAGFGSGVSFYLESENGDRLQYSGPYCDVQEDKYFVKAVSLSFISGNSVSTIGNKSNNPNYYFEFKGVNVNDDGSVASVLFHIVENNEETIVVEMPLENDNTIKNIIVTASGKSLSYSYKKAAPDVEAAYDENGISLSVSGTNASDYLNSIMSDPYSMIKVSADNGYSVYLSGKDLFIQNGNSILIDSANIKYLVNGTYTFSLSVPSYVEKRVSFTVDNAGTAEENYGPVASKIVISGIEAPVYKGEMSIGDYTVTDGNKDISSQIELSWIKINSGIILSETEEENVFGVGTYGLLVKYTHANNGNFGGTIDAGFGKVEDFSVTDISEKGFVVDSKADEYFVISVDVDKPLLDYSGLWLTRVSFYENSVMMSEPVFETLDGKTITGSIKYYVEEETFNSLSGLNNRLSSLGPGTYAVAYDFEPDALEDYRLASKHGELSITIKEKGKTPSEMVFVKENGEYRIYSTNKEFLSNAVSSKLVITQGSTVKEYADVLSYSADSDYLSVSMPDLSEFEDGEIVISLMDESYGSTKEFVTSKSELMGESLCVGKEWLSNVVKPSALSADYGTLTGDLKLEQNNENGTWKFKDNNVYVGDVGTNMLDIVFVPELSLYYAEISDKIQVTVNKVDLSIIPDKNQSKYYGEADPEFKFTVEGLKGNDTISAVEGKLSREEGESVDTYKFVLGTLNAKNYNLVLKDEVFTILRKQVGSGNVVLDQSEFTYDGNEKTVTVTVKEGDRTLTEGTDYVIDESSVLSSVNAGTYNVKVSGTGNYSFEENLSWTIKKAPFTDIVVEGVDKIYDSLPSSVSVSGYPEGSKVMYSEDGIDYQYTNIEVTNATEKEIWVKVTNDNYEDFIQKTVIKIAKKAVQPSLALKEREYDGTTAPYVMLHSLVGICDGDKDKVDYTYKAEFEDKNAGENKTVRVYDLKFTEGSDQNYYFDSEEYELKSTILPKEISATISEGSGVYGETIKYPEVTLNGVVDGDDVKAALIYKQGDTVLDKLPDEAGTYTVSAIINDSNYSLVCEDKSFVIEKAENDGTVSYPGFMYDAYDSTVVPVLGGYYEEPEVTFYLSKNGSLENGIKWSDLEFDQLIPGKYFVYATLSETDNYKAFVTEATEFKVSKNNTLSKKVSVDAYKGTYDAKSHTVSVNIDKGLGNVTVSYSEVKSGTYSESPVQLTDAGSLKIYVKFSKYGYDDAIIESNINIDALEAELKWSDTELTYNGKYQKPSVSITNLIGDDAALAMTEGNGNKDAGKYTVSAVSIDNCNYKLPENCSVSYEIKPLKVSISSKESEFIYDGSAKAPAVTIDNVLGGDKVKAVTDDYGVNAGTYKATYVLDNKNYVLFDDSIDFVINPKKLDGTMVSLSKYGLTYNGSELNILDDNLNVEDGNILTANDYTVSGTVKATDYGDYQFKVTGRNNYYGEVVVKWSIGKAQIEGISCEDVVVTYDGKAHMPVVEGLTDKDVVTYSLSIDGSMPEAIEDTELNLINSGEYKVFYKVIRDNNENHSPYIGSAVVKINKLPVVTVWSNLSFVFDGELHNPSVRINNLIGDDTVNITLSEPNRNAGIYTAKIVSLDNSNYDLPVNNSMSYTIKPKDVTVTITVPDDNKYNSVSEAEYVLNGYIEGYEPEVTLTYKGGSYNSVNVPVNAGEYVVEASISDANYNLTGNISEHFVIAKIDPVFTVPSGFKATYGEKANQITPAISEFNTDNGSWSWKDSTAFVGDAGYKNITAVYTPKDAVNYNTMEVAVEVEVDKATLTVSHPDLVATYGDTYNDIKSQLAPGFSFIEDLNLNDEVGNASDTPYIIKLVYTPENTENYHIVELECRIFVNKAYPIINWNEYVISVEEGTLLKDIVLAGFTWRNPEAVVSDVNEAIYHLDDNHIDIKVNVPVTIKRKITVGNKELDVLTKTKIVNDSGKNDVSISNDALSNSALDIVSGNESSNVKSSLTETQKQTIQTAVENEATVSVETSIKKIEITNEDKKEEIKQILADNEHPVAYLDLSVEMNIKVVDGEKTVNIDSVKVSQLAEPLTVTVNLPEDFEEPEVEDNQTVVYFVLVVHDGRTYKIPAQLNDDGTVSFDAQQFSYYTLSYRIVDAPIPSKPQESAPSDNGSSIPDIAGEVLKTVVYDGTKITGVIDYVSVDGWTYSLTGAANDTARAVLLATANGSVKVSDMPAAAKNAIEAVAGKGASSYVTPFFDLSLRDANWQKVEKKATFTLTLSKDVTKGLKSVYVLHMKADGSFECVPATLKGNDVTFTLNSQSPVAYVLNYGTTSTPVVNTAAN